MPQFSCLYTPAADKYSVIGVNQGEINPRKPLNTQITYFQISCWWRIHLHPQLGYEVTMTYSLLFIVKIVTMGDIKYFRSTLTIIICLL